MRVAVVGSGVSGLVASWMLQREHEVTLFEAEARLGGHTHTVTVPAGPGGADIDVDTGFIVFNRRTYPLFCRMLATLGVGARDSDMGFSVQVEANGVEYCGRGMGGLFAQKRNWLRPAHWRMIRDLLRFYREAPALLEGEEDPTLGEYLRRNGYSRVFIDEHLVPMAAAVWSADPAGILAFPARTLVRFFRNHGFLDVKDRPTWLTVPGGSHRYVEALIADFGGTVRTGAPVRQVARDTTGVSLTLDGGEVAQFDQVVIATHGDTALRMLASPTPREQEVLSRFSFQANDVILHTDVSLLPRTEATWSAWNYFVPRDGAERATVTYWMNQLQGLESPKPLLVTLNRRDEIDPATILGEYDYDHPVFDQGAVAAQERHAEISGADRIHYAGAWWRYGFHEDGVWSAVRVAEALGVSEEVLG